MRSRDADLLRATPGPYVRAPVQRALWKSVAQNRLASILAEATGIVRLGEQAGIRPTVHRSARFDSAGRGTVGPARLPSLRSSITLPQRQRTYRCPML